MSEIGARSNEPDIRRIWLGIALATVPQTISYGSIIVGAVASVTEGDVPAGPAFAIGFALVPLVFVAAAFGSAQRRAATSVLKGMGIWLVLGMPMSLANPIVGLSVGYTAAGVFTLRTTAVRPAKARWLAVLITAAYLLVLIVILPQAAILAGALTPLLAIRAADVYSERKEALREGGLGEDEASG